MIKEFVKGLRQRWHRDILNSIIEKQDVCNSYYLEETNLGNRIESKLTEIENDIKEITSLYEETKLIKKQIDDLKNYYKSSFEYQMEQFKDIYKKSEANIITQIKKNDSLDSFIRYTEIQKVFSLLCDRESQKIFWARIHYSIKRDLVPLYSYLIESERLGNPKDIISLLRNKIEGVNSDELIMYGTTETAKQLLLVIRGLNCKVDYICMENNVTLFTHGDEPSLIDYHWFDIPLITEDELCNKHKDADIIIGDILCRNAYKYLTLKGISEKRIYRRFSQWEKQYFDYNIISPHAHEIFIDGGAWDMQNTIDFIEWCHGDYDEVFAFEPNRKSYQYCERIIKNNPLLQSGNIHLYSAALWNKDEQLTFNDEKEDGSTISGNGNSTVEGKSIDSILAGKVVTFIKLDIEGAELAALKGAKESIKRWKPRLAICIYHKAEDPIEIPLYIHGLVPEYKMYIRHYSTCRDETVLYCV